ncbi:MAG: LemA family protein [Bacilli bacterium]|nr:LemA family protein [Bacilli bacterium]
METILLIIVIISFLAFIFVIINNRFQLTIIKIDKAEEDIDIYLDKKKDLLIRTRPIVKKELKIKEFLEDLDNFDDTLNNFEKHNQLKIIYNELFKILDENEKLLKSDSLVKILEELNDNEENIIGAIKFYNDSVVSFNQLIVSFPASIIALFKRYKKLEFYNNEKREIFEILNQK